MTIPRLTTVRFEQVISEGRTHPVVLACRADDPSQGTQPMLVKAIGCPEITSTWQLVAEVVGNAAARRMGVATPAPSIVSIGEAMAALINRSLGQAGFSFSIKPGDAAGCEFIPGLVNYTVGQNLTPEMRSQAARLFAFDMLSQNPDRRTQKVNCALNSSGLIAFDFELSFSHRFLPILGASSLNAWEPSTANLARNHLFYGEMKRVPPDVESIREVVARFTPEWWDEVRKSLPEHWRADADKIGVDLHGVANRAGDFAQDLTGRCLL